MLNYCQVIYACFWTLNTEQVQEYWVKQELFTSSSPAERTMKQQMIYLNHLCCMCWAIPCVTSPTTINNFPISYSATSRVNAQKNELYCLTLIMFSAMLSRGGEKRIGVTYQQRHKEYPPRSESASFLALACFLRCCLTFINKLRLNKSLASDGVVI